MKIKSLLLILLTSLVILSCKDQIVEEIILNEIIIEGTTVGTDAKQIVLVAPYQDPRFDSLIRIPIVNNKFSYQIETDQPLFFDLFLDEGYGRLMPLFIGPGTVNLTIYDSDNFDDNRVVGSKYQDEYKAYKKQVELPFNMISDSINELVILLKNTNEYLTTEGLKNKNLLNNANQEEKTDLYKLREALSEEGRLLTVKSQKLEDLRNDSWLERNERVVDYLTKNASLVSYYQLTLDLQFKMNVLDYRARRDLLKRLDNSFPNHLYSSQTLSMIESHENPVVGNQFIDFRSPDLEGKSVKLSHEINGKVTVLDLWGTWCGPCIAKTNKLKPLYEKYKNQNFTIIGVAGEFKNTKALNSFLNLNTDWTWKQLVELERENKIWQQYAVDGGGGGIFLIDKNGIVIAKDPSYEQVEHAILNQ